MAKYPHNEDSLIVLKDIENRLVQLIEASEAYKDQLDPQKYEGEQQGLSSALMVVKQAIRHGHVFRGSDFVPDGLLPYVKTPSPTHTLITKLYISRSEVEKILDSLSLQKKQYWPFKEKPNIKGLSTLYYYDEDILDQIRQALAKGGTK